MTLLEALKNNKKVRVDFVNEQLGEHVYLVFTQASELAKLIDMILGDVYDYNFNGIDYQKTLLCREEEIPCSGIIEA